MIRSLFASGGHATLALVLAGLTFLGGCDAPPAATATAGNEALPATDAYAGSRTCKSCHAGKFERWSHDWHARALTAANPETVVADFENAHYSGASSTAWMHRQSGAYYMRTAGGDGQEKDYRVDWLLGGKRMQDPVTVLADGRWQVLPVYFHVSGGEWVDYTEDKQGVVGPGHPFFWTNFRRTANHECLDCHTTGLEVQYDPASHRWSTNFADSGVACESCHGPGARHIRTEKPEDIVHPAKLEPRLGLAVCAQCHGPRLSFFPLLDAEHRFKPGQSYEDRYSALMFVIGEGRSGDFFADGRPDGSSFEYQAMLQSRCFMRGGATCLTCHTAPHEPHVENELAASTVPAAFGEVSASDATCFECHAGLFVDRSQHSHHSSEAGQSCVGCHMPKILESVRDQFADHSIDVPVPQNTLRHGVPNACNGCHSEESPEAMAAAIERWWPRASERQARRLRLADAIDEKTAGESLPALEAVLADTGEAPRLRGEAATLLAQRFPQAAESRLVPLLASADPELRLHVTQALGIAGARGAGEAIAPLLEDSSAAIRQMAALVLDSFGDPRGLEVLEQLTSDPRTRGLVRPHLALGAHLAREGDVARAIGEVETAVSLKPYDTQALVLLADLYAGSGELPRAVQLLRETLQFDPRHRGALGRLQSLEQ